MLKTEIALERIFGTIIPGALFVLGAWYLHRPFLLRYFPNIAGDPSQANVIGTEFKIAIFIVVAFSIGLILNQLSDIGIVLLFKDDAISPKSSRKVRRIVRLFWRVIVFTRIYQDPRTRAVTRYLESPRRVRFLRLMEDWAGTNEDALKSPNEVIVAHQHVIFHLRVHSETSRRLLDNAYLPVIFSSSILAAFVLLVPVVILSFWTSEIVDEGIRVHFYRTLLGVLALIYAGVAISSYSLKRQFKQFCHYVLTLALHLHELPEHDSEKGIDH
ncbi:MAG: hypothetical protein JO360_14325 [Acidobacteria bacterium]|nr:hypothetical protein [Acidobacteriota bacterium]